jgi:hypothetical protein
MSNSAKPIFRQILIALLILGLAVLWVLLTARPAFAA